MDSELYRELIIEHYKHPQNAGRLLACSFSQKELNPSCGDVIEIFVDLKDGVVAEVKFEGRGCAISQASASMLTEKIKGMTLDELRALKQDDVFEMLAVPLSGSRIRCALLSLKALHKGLETFKN